MSNNGYTPLTIGRGIRCAAEYSLDSLALDDTIGNSRTYRQLVSRMNAIGELAKIKGLKLGDVVALVSPNCIEYPEIVAGLSEHGIVIATLNPMLAAEEFVKIFADCSPRLIIAAETVQLPDERPETLFIGGQLDAELAECDRKPTLPKLDEQDTFAIAYTSGTTGAPKGVLLSHRSRCLMFYAMASEYGCFGRDDHFLALAPMCHGAGLAFALAPLYLGGRCTLHYNQEPETILSALAEYQPDGIFVVPTHLHRIRGMPKEILSKYRGHHSLRSIISNAAALIPSLKEFAVEYFGPGLLHESYGSTEAGIVTNMRPSCILEKPRSVGTAFSNFDVEIRRVDGSCTSPGEPGELFSRSPFTFNGYLNRPLETNVAMINGWVTVGDIATRDAEGMITITDRKKDMVVTGGMNVYPREIETIIEAIPEVTECAVVGRPDEEWGEVLHAYTVLSKGATLKANDITDFCRRQLASYKVPKQVSFIEALPRSAAGKILKNELRSRSVDSR